MNDILIREILIVVTLVIVFSAVSMWWHLRKRKSSWEGTVTKVRSRKSSTSQDPESHGVIKTYYDITCKLDNGGKKKIKLDSIQKQWMFPSGIQEGNRLIKVAGEDGYRLES